MGYKNVKKEDDRNFAIICESKRSGKRDIVWNTMDRDTDEESIRVIKDTWKKSVKNYEVLQVVKIKNIRTLMYFVYWDKFKITRKLTQESFDFFKYVLEADLNEKFRPEF